MDLFFMEWLNWFTEAVARRAPFNLRIESTRYLTGAVGTWFVIWVLLGGLLAARKIRKPTRRGPQIRREIRQSALTIIVFMFMGVFVFEGAAQGWFRFYSDVSDYGWAYLVLSIGALVVFHDAYFYWTHRLMHTKALFRHVHAVHHRSMNPTPFTAYSFNVTEAAINFMVIPIYCLIVPTHDVAIMIYMWIQIVRNALAHCGYELMPKGTTRHPILRQFASVTHHDMHHERMTGNYGFYFTWWDRWMGTEHADYEKRFVSVTEGRETASSPAPTAGETATTIT